ncbi:MAG: hypothetical protein JSS89_04165 [Bacteroidetes bacterium]|nr:hypothetical protein [Bacteroidota bacterium]
MNKTKYVLGCLFTVQIGAEYASVSRQVASWLTPLLPIMLLLLVSTWFIVSGHTGERVKLSSAMFWKYYGANCVACVVVAFIVVGMTRSHHEIVKVNGVDVDIAMLMEDMTKVIPDRAKRREYCVCVATKITADRDLVQKYKHDLESGKITDVAAKVLSGQAALSSDLNDCMFTSASALAWTPTLEKGIRLGLGMQIRESDRTDVIDSSAYCDCYVDELKKMPIKAWMSTEFAQSPERAVIDSICREKGRLDPLR